MPKRRTTQLFRNISVRRFSIERSDLLDRLALICGELHTQTTVRFWRVARKKNIWLSAGSMERLCFSRELHTHTSDEVVRTVTRRASLWQKRCRFDPDAQPPCELLERLLIQYRSSAIRYRAGFLTLSNGKQTPPTVIRWPWPIPHSLTIRPLPDGHYQALATYRDTPKH
jgi:hypothetical protein